MNLFVLVYPVVDMHMFYGINKYSSSRLQPLPTNSAHLQLAVGINPIMSLCRNFKVAVYVVYPDELRIRPLERVKKWRGSEVSADVFIHERKSCAG